MRELLPALGNGPSRDGKRLTSRRPRRDGAFAYEGGRRAPIQSLAHALTGQSVVPSSSSVRGTGPSFRPAGAGRRAGYECALYRACGPRPVVRGEEFL